MTQTTIIGATLLLCGGMVAQTPPTQNGNAATPVFRVTVTARTAKAINYQHRSGATKINFRGTDLLPNARGEAKVESKQGYIEIEVEFDNLQPAARDGSEYLTYVLWAITPEGRTANLGELLLNGTRGKLNVTTELQVFGLIVTAEPYFAVTQPSDLIVMENEVRPDTKGKIEEIDAKYELLQRGQYARMLNPLGLKFDSKQPLELYEARNAVQIARTMGAERYANETFQKAAKSLAQAEAYQARKAGKNPVTMTAREAVQTAEDARAIAVKRQGEEALAAERQGSLDRETRSETGRVAAQSETDRVTREAENARISAQAAADRLTQEKNTQLSASLAEAGRVKRETDARTAAATVEADRMKLENDTRAAAAKAEADRLKVDNDARIATATAEADRMKLENDARAAAAKAEADRLKVESDARIATATAEADRMKLENDARTAAAKAEADRLKVDSDARIAAATAVAERMQSENDARTAAAKAEADRMKAESESRAAAAKGDADRLKVENDSRLAASAAETDRLKRENEAQRAASQTALDAAAKQKTQLESEKAELRTQLLSQFNAILQTRDTARGLIVNMSDVLFDTGKFSLRPMAREKLAKVAGIVSGHPGLKLDVEGHTDSVGGDAYNQKLSEQRGGAVRDYMTAQGMPAGSVTSKGLGKSQPVSTNDTAAGRQLNRRVEIVISGDVIGTEIGKIASR